MTAKSWYNAVYVTQDGNLINMCSGSDFDEVALRAARILETWRAINPKKRYRAGSIEVVQWEN